MPITEAPPPQKPPSAGPTQRTRRGRAARESYEGLEGYDLLHVIDEIEDERARVSLREKIWIALILHMLVFAYLLFAPKYIWHVKVRDAGSVLRDKEKQVTVLDLPPDALKQLKPEKPAPLSDKNRQQQAAKPVPERKDLEAMRRAGPPAPKPAPKPLPQAPTPAPQPPQMARQQPAPPRPQPAPPVPTGQNTQLDAPKPQPTKPNFATGPQTPAEAVQQAARAARSAGGDMGANAPSQHGGNKGAVDVLSDTLGVDFGPYIQRVIYATKRSWYPIIPEVAQPPISKQGRVLIRFKILPDGSVKEMHLEGPSGDVSLDRAAWGGITGASPFPTLPKQFKGTIKELRL